MKRVEKLLITGAGGFIGHHLARYLRKKGYWVRGADILYPKYSPLSDFDEFKILDLRDFRNCIEAFDGIDKVFALAALNGSIEYTTNERAVLVHDNATININTAEAAARTHVKRLFYSSSACVYPIWKQMEGNIGVLSESDAYPAMPDSEYGWEKLFSERLYKSYEKDFGLDVRIARFFNIYGSECLIDTLKSKAPMALTRKVIQAGNNGTVEIWGDGKQVRSFCYVDDCCEGIWKLMESDIHEPINIGTSDHININDLVDLISKIENIKVKKIHQLDKVQGVRERLCDFSKAERLLNWKAKMSLEKGLIQVNKFVHKELGM